MGSRNTTEQWTGLAIADERISSSALVDSSVANVGSDYTEQVPRPGVGVPDDSATKATPLISNGQAADVTVGVLKGGNPTLDDGAQLSWSTTSQSYTNGWNPPNTINDFMMVDYQNSDTTERHALVAIPGTQTVIAMYRSFVSGTEWNILIRRLEHDGTYWVAPVVLDDGAHEVCAVALMCLPSQRVVAIVLNSTTAAAPNADTGDSYYSDDDGATWAAYSKGSISGAVRPTFDTTGGNTAKASAVCSSTGNALLVIQTSASTSTVSQYASRDLGQTWTRVVETTTSPGTRHSTAVLPDGTFLVAYQLSNDFYVARLGSAFQSYQDVTSTIVADTGIVDVDITVDADGMVWLFGKDNTAGGAIQVLYSTDGARTFTQLDYGAVYVDSGSSNPTDIVTTSQGGKVVLNCTSTNATAPLGNSLMTILLGGWSSVTYVNEDQYSSALKGRIGFSEGNTASTFTGCYLPWDLPSNVGWSTSGGAPSLSSSGGLVISTSGTRSQSYRSPAATGDLEGLVLFAQLKVGSGGSSSSNDVFIDVRFSGASERHNITLRFTTTEVTVYDVLGAADLGTLTPTTGNLITTFQVLLTFNQLYFNVWLFRPGDSQHQDSVNATPASVASTSLDRVTWGHGNVTASSTWYALGWVNRYDVVGDGAVPTALLERGKLGRYMSSGPIPLTSALTPSAIGAAQPQSAYLSMVGGPAILGDTWTITKDADYPVRRLFPPESPSPSQPWRGVAAGVGVDPTEEVFSFDLAPTYSNESTLGRSFVVAFLGCNFKTAYVEYWNGAAWTTAHTYNGAVGFEGLTFDVAGNVITPEGATLKGGRPINEGELVGGHLLQISGGAGATTISTCHAGEWTGSVGKTVQLQVDDPGTLVAGTCDLVWPSGVCVIHAPGVDTWSSQYWRIRIPAQTTPPITSATSDRFFKATILIGRLGLFGQAPSWTWSDTTEPNVGTETDARGTLRRRQLGPNRRVWSLNWADVVDERPLRHPGVAATSDYLGTSAGPALVRLRDIKTLLPGLLREAKGGELPIIALADIPTSSATITDPTLWLYGTIDSGVTYTNVTGKVGTDELGKVDAIRIIELV